MKSESALHLCLHFLGMLQIELWWQLEVWTQLRYRSFFVARSMPDPLDDGSSASRSQEWIQRCCGPPFWTAVHCRSLCGLLKIPKADENLPSFLLGPQRCMPFPPPLSSSTWHSCFSCCPRGRGSTRVASARSKWAAHRLGSTGDRDSSNRVGERVVGKAAGTVEGKGEGIFICFTDWKKCLDCLQCLHW